MPIIEKVEKIKKGQAATEYLLMLSILLIIILASIMMFTNIPSIVSQLASSGHRDFWYYADIGIRSHTLYSDGTLVLNIKNNKAAPITIEKVWLNTEDYNVDIKLEPGERKIIKLNINKRFTPGEPYTFKIGFDYSLLNEHFEFKPDIPISGSVQK